MDIEEKSKIALALLEALHPYQGSFEDDTIHEGKSKVVFWNIPKNELDNIRVLLRELLKK